MERQERRFGKAVMGFVRGTHFRPSGRANYLHILSWLEDAETWAISLSEEMAHHSNEKASVGQVVEKGWLGDGGDLKNHPLRPRDEGPIGRGPPARFLPSEPRLAGLRQADRGHRGRRSGGVRLRQGPVRCSPPNPDMGDGRHADYLRHDRGCRR
jgi:hypothetical protein